VHRGPAAQVKWEEGGRERRFEEGQDEWKKGRKEGTTCAHCKGSMCGSWHFIRGGSVVCQCQCQSRKKGTNNCEIRSYGTSDLT
jgi:hypothetical protein